MTTTAPMATTRRSITLVCQTIRRIWQQSGWDKSTLIKVILILPWWLHGRLTRSARTDVPSHSCDKPAPQSWGTKQHRHAREILVEKETDNNTNISTQKALVSSHQLKVMLEPSSIESRQQRVSPSEAMGKLPTDRGTAGSEQRRRDTQRSNKTTWKW